MKNIGKKEDIADRFVTLSSKVISMKQCIEDLETTLRDFRATNQYHEELTEKNASQCVF